MTPIKRRIAAVSAPVLLALSLTACGGGPGGDAPDDASAEEFCTAFAKAATLEDGKSINDWADDMADVGTPEGISDDERKGFEVLVDAAADVDGDSSLADLDDKEVSGDDKKAVEAFSGYAGKTCAEQLGGELPAE